MQEDAVALTRLLAMALTVLFARVVVFLLRVLPLRTRASALALLGSRPFLLPVLERLKQVEA